MVRHTACLILAVAALGLAGYACAADASAKAPAFTLEDQDGNKVSLSDFEGKIVVIQWINWDCPFDKRHHKAGTLKSLHEKYADKGVVFLGINSTKYHTKEVNKKKVAELGLPYPVLDDHPGTVGHAYNAKTTPDMRIIHKDGTLVYAGAMDNDPRGNKGDDKINYVDQALGELLAGKPVSTPKTRPYGCSVKYAK